MLIRRRLKLRRRNSRQYQRTIVSAIHNMSVSSRVLCADQNACHGSQVFSLMSDCRAMRNFNSQLLRFTIGGVPDQAGKPVLLESKSAWKQQGKI
ncbi:hypothetical protein D5086_024889 [Populus alba]|uniref:Uncharacterized protein n=1 Tax=Populus alba TaxID=43335 RepID=A0ACC4B7F4_POPAL